MAIIEPALLAALLAKTELSRAAIYARIQKIARDYLLPNNLAAVKVAADEGLAINRFATAEQLAQLRQAGSPVAPPVAVSRKAVPSVPLPRGKSGSRSTRKIPNQVFVVHGRDINAKSAMFAFVRSIGIKPIEWTSAVAMSKKAAPFVSEILDAAFSRARAIIVLLTADDLAQLRPDLLTTSDAPYEAALTGQARPNVLFECGMAFVSHPDRTVIVQVGNVRPFSDTVGRHVVHMSNEYEKRHELATKLKNAGCDVDISGTDWVKTGDFSDPMVKKPKGRR